MSMGYDYDDPRDQEVRRCLRAGVWRVPEGERANVDASKFRAGALPSGGLRTYRRVLIK